ncbi:hypothetical protein ACFOZ7_18590 [Natribaculum luteum]|uniref:DUF8009 domain-containing protein n=1 Tax=Natribaculum luteum TaxID=1586232 RepID=A0ABD5P3X3_9EURY|nr:hypothetical protein [Natribaculum luteum]
MAGDADPSTIRSLAVSKEDVVNAFVYGRENPGTAVLRATPPFHGRMRARIHVYQVDDTRLTGAIHVHPADLLESEVVEEYPALEGVEDDLAAGDGEADPERVREEHARALEEWQKRARERIVDDVGLEVDGVEVHVDVKTLG